MSIFEGIEEVTVYRKNPKLQPGKHKLKVIELLVKDSERERGKKFFIAEFEVVESAGGRPTTAQPDAAPGTSIPFNAGEIVSWRCGLSHEYERKNLKGFAMALGAAEHEITNETMEALIGGDQPAAGVEVIADCHIALSQSTGRDYVRTHFRQC
tara:strand:- start:204 stop:665 length:462 start_codon:yes stop_codon:yes gene_type:complete